MNTQFDKSDILSIFIIPEYNIRLVLYYLGGNNVGYEMFKDNNVLFSGDDFKPSILYPIDSIQSPLSLMGFLTVQRWDTDDDYFKNYTVEQLEFADSFECEQIKVLLSDLEDDNSEYHNNALERIVFTHE